MLGIIGVIITIIVAAKRKDNILLSIVISGVGMVFWIFIFISLVFPPVVEYTPTYTPSYDFSYCGDGICQSTEGCFTCPSDCGECPAPTLKYEVTIHSAEKSYSIGDYDDLDSGEIFLIVDFSIKNNGRSTYSYNPYYVEIEDEDHYTYEHTFASYSMSNYFDMVSIHPDDTKRGTLAFEVPITSHSYKLILVEDMLSSKTYSATIGEVEGPGQEISGEISIEKVDYDWNEYESEFFEDDGYISEIECEVSNTGNVPYEPRFDIKITHSGDTVYIEEDAESWLFGNLMPGDTEEITLSVYQDIDDDGDYKVEVTMKAGIGGDELDTDTETVDIG
jgi:hypothetical protein